MRKGMKYNKYNTELVANLATKFDCSEAYIRKCIRNDNANSEKADLIRNTYQERAKEIQKHATL